MKTTAFARLTQKLGDYPLYAQIACSGGLIKKLSSHQGSIRVNDAFYLPNFKGIRNLGYYFDPEAKKKGLGGDILGFDKYMSLGVKVS